MFFCTFRVTKSQFHRHFKACNNFCFLRALKDHITDIPGHIQENANDMTCHKIRVVDKKKKKKYRNFQPKLFNKLEPCKLVLIDVYYLPIYIFDIPNSYGFNTLLDTIQSICRYADHYLQWPNLNNYCVLCS